MNRKVIELSRSEKYLDKVRLLRSVPGIGILIGMELLVELPEMKRFKSGDELASYIYYLGYMISASNPQVKMLSLSEDLWKLQGGFS
jgi:hypothetical protein